MINVGDLVVVTSYKYTEIHNGRKSEHNIGDMFRVANRDEDTLHDGNYNFVNINDVRLATDTD